jgi:Lrp/AsnC family transcriptional regulator, regulator for asnA, asnC and gidA
VQKVVVFGLQAKASGMWVPNEIIAGSFDLLIEVVCEDDDQLLEILSRVRSIPSVTATETFVYLKLRKQTYSWGTR